MDGLEHFGYTSSTSTYAPSNYLVMRFFHRRHMRTCTTFYFDSELLFSCDYHFFSCLLKKLTGVKKPEPVGAFGYKVHFLQSPTITFHSLRVTLTTFSGIRFAKVRPLLDIWKTER